MEGMILAVLILVSLIFLSIAAYICFRIGASYANTKQRVQQAEAAVHATASTSAVSTILQTCMVFLFGAQAIDSERSLVETRNEINTLHDKMERMRQGSMKAADAIRSRLDRAERYRTNCRYKDRDGEAESGDFSN